MNRRKYPFTLLEMLLVMLLIGTISSIAAVNFKKILERSRIFQTEQILERVEEALNYAYVNEGVSAAQIERDYPAYLANSPLISKVDKVLRDGWGQPIEVHFNTTTQTFEATSTSPAYQKHRQKKHGQAALL